MKAIQLLIISLALVLAAQPLGAQTPTHFFSHGYGGALNDYAEDIYVDDGNGVTVVGRFSGTANFGGGNLVSAGGDDIFVARYDDDGNHLWSQGFGSTSADQAYAVAVDFLGNVVVAGSFNLTVDFGGGGITTNGNVDIFLVKFDGFGNHQWSFGVGGTGADAPFDLAIDSGGNIYMVGLFNSTVNFGGGNLVSAGGSDIFVAKYSAAGGHSWSQRYGDTSADLAYGVALDDLERPVIGGSYRGTIDFGGGGLVSMGQADIFVAKYGITGIHMWSQNFGGPGSDRLDKLDVGGDGTVAFCGTFRDSIDFGGGQYVSNGSSDTYVASYDENGAYQWSRQVDNPDNSGADGVAVDALGNVYLAAWLDGTADFGGGPIGADSSTDLAVAKYSVTGEHRWSISYNATNHIYPKGMDLDNDANLVITGYYRGSVNFGGGVITSANNDPYFVKLGGPVEPLITSITDIGNDQGKKVKIRFERSGQDAAASPTPVLGYDVYRRADTPPSVAPRNGDVVQPHNAPPGWTYLATAPAHGETSYGIDVNTLADSTETHGQFWSAFFIRASTAQPTTFWDSEPDSGYSLDNLSPGVPAAAAVSEGILSWVSPNDPDLDHFTVYGAPVDDFGAAVVVDFTTNELLDVSASPYAYYFVTATDVSGNESAPAQTESPTSIGGTPQRYILSVGNHPNPFNPSTTVRYTIPSQGLVTVAVYDVRGALVKTLVNKEHNSGAYVTEWNGRDAQGAAASSGVYFARIEHGGINQTRKMLLIK